MKYQFRTLTTPVKGIYNIRNVVKSDLQYFSGYDYIVKTDVVQIIINKIDGLKSDDVELDDKTYRYKGRFERGNDIVFDKAWNTNKKLF